MPFVEQSCIPMEQISLNLAPTSVGESVKTTTGEVAVACSVLAVAFVERSVASSTSSVMSRPVVFSIMEAIAL